MTTGRINQVTSRLQSHRSNRGRVVAPSGGSSDHGSLEPNELKTIHTTNNFHPQSCLSARSALQPNNGSCLVTTEKLHSTKSCHSERYGTTETEIEAMCIQLKKIKYHCWNSGFQQSIQPKRKKNTEQLIKPVEELQSTIHVAISISRPERMKELEAPNTQTPAKRQWTLKTVRIEV